MDFVSPFLDLLFIFPSWLIVLIISAVPLIELRGSIPIAIGFLGMNPVVAFILAVAGNMLPIFLIFYLLEPVSIFLSRHSPFFEKHFDRLFKRDEKQGNQNAERVKNLALALFVALPLPFTGAWIAAAAAIALRFNLRNAFISIFAGVIAAGVLVTMLTISDIQIWGGIFNQ
jgi:uncharacterized membrane protein